MSHKILNEIYLILPNLSQARKEKRGIIASLITGIIGLAYEGISSYLHNRRQKAMNKAFIAIENYVNPQHNKIIHLENSMTMYGIYNSETLEKLIDTVHKMHNTTTWNEELFASKLDAWYKWYLSKDGISNCAINSLLYLRTLWEKYIHVYKEFISQLHMYEKAVRIFSKGYLPISLLPPSKLQKILEVKKAIQKTNPDYDTVIKTIFTSHMKSVTLGIDRHRNLIIIFPVFIQPYMQQPLILYQIEPVPIPIVDQNKQANSYMHFQIDKPYTALNSETYILIGQQELGTCKKIGYKFYYKQLFMVKHNRNLEHAKRLVTNFTTKNFLW